MSLGFHSPVYGGKGGTRTLKPPLTNQQLIVLAETSVPADPPESPDFLPTYATKNPWQSDLRSATQFASSTA